MIILKQTKHGWHLNGFTVKPGFWVGRDEALNQPVVSSGWENNRQLAIYRFVKDKWILDWVDEDRSHIYPCTTYEKVNNTPFDEWFEAEYGESFFDYVGYLGDVEEAYQSYLYGGAPRFARV